jgi:hypothetical protein
MKSLFIVLLVAVVVSSGWILNLVKLADLDFEAPYKTEVFRVVGLVPPVGMVMGWITFEEEEQ